MKTDRTRSRRCACCRSTNEAPWRSEIVVVPRNRSIRGATYTAGVCEERRRDRHGTASKQAGYPTVVFDNRLVGGLSFDQDHPGGPTLPIGNALSATATSQPPWRSAGSLGGIDCSSTLEPVTQNILTRWRVRYQCLRKDRHRTNLSRVWVRVRVWARVWVRVWVRVVLQAAASAAAEIVIAAAALAKSQRADRQSAESKGRS